ncbi:MAG: pseudaminic acid cytidylyltransferase [Lentisphaerae bacterium]|nr:pseudaminic acid cytidylyltransferase [Lentisphaerota bacterium]
MNVAVIPARGGSKRIPRKNLRPFNGKPVLAYAIDAARQCGCVDRILVSTDDDEVASLARSLGAEVPFRRPPDLADDHAPLGAVMRHAVQWMLVQGWDLDYVACLFATAPFLTPAILRDALHRLQADPSMQYAFGAARFPFPIQRAVRILPGGGVEPFTPRCMGMRSQDLEDAYHDAGQFFWGRPDAILARATIFSPRSIPVVIPSCRVQDIDTPEDWERAEFLHQALHLSESHASRLPG